MFNQTFTRTSTVTATLIGLLLIGVAGCGDTATTSPTSVSVTPSVIGVAPRQPNQMIVVDARVIPIRSANLEFALKILNVTEVLVQEGTSVTKGTPLARLNIGNLQLKVSASKAALALAQAEHDRLVAGATKSELDIARADLAVAQARLRQAQNTVSPADIEAAKARLVEAQARRAQLEAGPQPDVIQDAIAARDQAQSELNRVRTGFSANKEQARYLIEDAANQVRLAQQDVSSATWAYQQATTCTSGNCPGGSSGNSQTQDLAAQLQHRQLLLDNTQLALKRAKLSYEVAQEDERNGIAAAEAILTAAQVHLNQLRSGPTNVELKSVLAAEIEAKARLAQLQEANHTGKVDEAIAGVSAAQARLDGLMADPRSADLATTAAVIEQATAELHQAEYELEQATLVASMDGVVAEINIVPGEIPSAIKPAIVLADTSAWQLEASQITDLNIVRVAAGTPVAISFDALPDLKVTGHVNRIRPVGQNSQGETLYTIYITPDNWDSRLRWNMIAQVRISL